MKKLVLLIFVFALPAHANEFVKMSRPERCKAAGGEVSSNAVPQDNKTKKTESFSFGPIDCTCGGKRFNPLREGDVCKNGKILTSLENYCEGSKGDLTMKAASSKTKWPAIRMCTCGGEEFNPTKTSTCTA